MNELLFKRIPFTDKMYDSELTECTLFSRKPHIVVDSLPLSYQYMKNVLRRSTTQKYTQPLVSYLMCIQKNKRFKYTSEDKTDLNFSSCIQRKTHVYQSISIYGDAHTQSLTQSTYIYNFRMLKIYMNICLFFHFLLLT